MKFRNSWLSAILPFDDVISYHKFIGIIGFLAATIHTLCHVADVINWSDSDRAHLYEKAFPGTDQPSLWELCALQVAVTGILLYTIMCVAYLFALDYPKRLQMLQNTKIGAVRIKHQHLGLLCSLFSRCSTISITFGTHIICLVYSIFYF